MTRKYLVKTLVINGITHRVVADPEEKLVNVIRKQLHLTGTKWGADRDNAEPATSSWTVR